VRVRVCVCVCVYVSSMQMYENFTIPVFLFICLFASTFISGILDFAKQREAPHILFQGYKINSIFFVEGTKFQIHRGAFRGDEPRCHVCREGSRGVETVAIIRLRFQSNADCVQQYYEVLGYNMNGAC